MIYILFPIFISLYALAIHVAARFDRFDDFDEPKGSLERISWDNQFHGKPEGKEVLWWLRFYGNKILPRFYRKPVYGCPICMCSLWGIPVTIGLSYMLNFEIISLNTLVTYFICFPVASGINLLVVNNLHIK